MKNLLLVVIVSLQSGCVSIWESRRHAEARYYLGKLEGIEMGAASATRCWDIFDQFKAELNLKNAAKEIAE